MRKKREIIEKAILKGLQGALSNTNQHEPQLVANLVWHIPNAINVESSLPIKAAGVFIHQTPKVKSGRFKNHESVELGDLLLLREKGKKTRALLLQAKKVDCIPEIPKNDDQHYLYAKQPRFKYVNSGKRLNGRIRRITGLNTYDGCQYLLVNKKPKINGPLAWTAHPSSVNSRLTHYSDFANVLVDFILGYDGRECNGKPYPSSKNWDRVIDDMVKVITSRESVYMSRVTGNETSERGVCLFYCGTMEILVGSGELCPNGGPSAKNSNSILNKIPDRPEENNEELPISLSIIKFTIDEKNPE